jgi:recyclin-1
MEKMILLMGYLVEVEKEPSLSTFRYSSFPPYANSNLDVRETASAASSQTAIDIPITTSSAATPTPSLNSQLRLHQTTQLPRTPLPRRSLHADRESLKRAEPFAGYPGHYGRRVRDTIEEIFISLLQVLGEKHVFPGFGR